MSHRLSGRAAQGVLRQPLSRGISTHSDAGVITRQHVLLRSQSGRQRRRNVHLPRLGHQRQHAGLFIMMRTTWPSRARETTTRRVEGAGPHTHICEGACSALIDDGESRAVLHSSAWAQWAPEVLIVHLDDVERPTSTLWSTQVAELGTALTESDPDQRSRDLSRHGRR